MHADFRLEIPFPPQGPCARLGCPAWGLALQTSRLPSRMYIRQRVQCSGVGMSAQQYSKILPKYSFQLGLPVEDSSKYESLGAEGLRLSPWQTAPPFTDGKAEVMLLNLAGSFRSAAGGILLQLSYKLFWNA